MAQERWQQILNGQPSTSSEPRWKQIMDGQAPTTGGVGKIVSDIGGAAKTGAMKMLDWAGDPQQMLFGGLLEGTEGIKHAWNDDREYSGKDILNKLGLLKNDPYYSQSIAGLGLDLIADPLNLVGVGATRKLLGKAVDVGTSKLVNSALLNPVMKVVRPLHELDKVEGLRDFARLAESRARSIGEHVNEDILKTLSPKFRGWMSKLPEEQQLKDLAYAVDEGRVGQLSAEQQAIAQRYQQKIDQQWNKEVLAGQQQPVNRLQNYVPYITKPTTERNVSVLQDISGTTRHSKQRTLQSLTDAVRVGDAEDNLAKILRRRLMSGDMAIHNAEIVNEAARKWGSMTPIAGGRKLDLTSARRIKLPPQQVGVISQQYFPKHVADYLEKAHTLWNKEEDVVNTYKKLVTSWKSWVVATPQQHATNLLGNIYNTYVHGDMSLNEMRKLIPETMKIVKGKKPMPAVRMGNRVLNGNEVEKLARDYEIIGTSGRYELPSYTSGKTYSFNPLNSNNVISKMSLDIGQHRVEEPFRLAVFLNHLRKGKSAEEAAIATKDVLFDYGELTDEFKFLRDYGVVPFITWISKNIPLQIESTLKHPDRLARVESLLTDTQNLMGGSDTIVPQDDTREGLLASGIGRATRLPLPLMDMNKVPLGDYSVGDARNDWAAGMAPQLKMPLEWLTGVKMYGPEKPRPIDNYGKSEAPYDAVSKLLSHTPLRGLAGISDAPEGPVQDPTMSWLLQNLPVSYWNKFTPTDDLNVKQPLGEQLLGIFGMRSKTITPKAGGDEITRRIQRMIMEP